MSTGTGSGGYRKKLIEVAMPLEAINKGSVHEKSVPRQGHPATMHLWWARRPLAAARAVLFAQLVDDPSSRPEEFPTEEDQVLERKRLFGIIERLVEWEKINDKALYGEARAEIWKSCGDNPPSILDPFAGGGSIPFEAQRLGLEAHASDLNPVPVLINKALIEIPSKWLEMPPVFPEADKLKIDKWPGATGLAEDVRRYGQWIRDEAEKRIGHLYPKARLEDGSEANVIAWIWARTVTCPNPACSGVMPLVRSFWLGKKKGKERYVEPVVEGKRVRFEIKGPTGTAREGTVGRSGATCLICNTPVPLTYIREEGKIGRMGAQLMVTVAEGPRMRYYIAPTAEHEEMAKIPFPENVPEGEVSDNPRWFSPPLFGMKKFSDLFSNRQLVALSTFGDLIAEARGRVVSDALSRGLPLGDPLSQNGSGAQSYGDSVAVYLAFALSKLADWSSTACSWIGTVEKVRDTFARQAIPMAWDYVEINPHSQTVGNFGNHVKWVSAGVQGCGFMPVGKVYQENAMSVNVEDRVISTDPPYYDNIGYADLSDFFYIWLRRSLVDVFPDLFGTLLTPKSDELIANPYRRGGKEAANRFFEDGFKQVFERIRNGASSSYPMTVFYAFKQSESDGSGIASTGWETLLEGMIRSGWAVTATWPLRTE
ncbi:DUF1156 domain-containing protein, partial [Planomonospora parontospora]